MDPIILSLNAQVSIPTIRPPIFPTIVPPGSSTSGSMTGGSQSSTTPGSATSGSRSTTPSSVTDGSQSSTPLIRTRPITTPPTTTTTTPATTAVASSTTSLATSTDATKKPSQTSTVKPTVDQTFVTNVSIGFDCRRHNHDCTWPGGFCDTETGRCRCLRDRQGYDCGVMTSSIRNETFCNNGEGCADDSYCLENGDNTQCFCGYGSFGGDCSQSRVELNCGDTDFEVIIHPYPSYSDFEGHIFILNNTSDAMIETSLCRFNSSNMTYTFSMDYQSLLDYCGGEKIDESTYGLRFVIQNHPHWLTAYDQILSAKCLVTVTQSYEKSILIHTNGNVRLYSGANALSNLQQNTIVGEHNTVIAQPAPMPNFNLERVLVDKVNGNWSVAPVQGPIKIGDTVMFSIANSDPSIYSSMRTEDCTLTMDNSIEMKLISQSCPASRAAWTLLRWDRTIYSPTTASFWLRLPANALSGWPRQIDIYCRVKLCLNDSAEQCDIVRNLF